MNTIPQRVQALLPEVMELRHTFHRIPEIAGQELKTADRIRQELAKLPVKILPPFLGTDTVALLETGRPGPHIALRADIDGLPITEETGLEYASQHPGFGHCCGHDGHIAMLLGAAKILCAMKDQLCGTIRFIFQPGEEVQAMGRHLVAAGALGEPPAELAAAIHGWPGIELGKITSCAGAIMAASGHFHVRISGRGGHSSEPQNAIDPIYVASQVISALQAIVSRNTDPRETAVVSVCYIHAGKSDNVIPAEVEFGGTTRALSPEIAAGLEDRMRQIIGGVCAAHGASYQMDYAARYQVSVNDPDAVQMAKDAAGENFEWLEKPIMASEDFAFYLEKVPGVLAFLGVGMDAPKLHCSNYNFNDAALGAGIEYFVRLVCGKALQTR
ncbi:MAG: amidohydrolase [Lentisphaeria bacterium]|nr:amidohydrolase [Lentisphaeria bacterium]